MSNTCGNQRGAQPWLSAVSLKATSHQPTGWRRWAGHETRMGEEEKEAFIMLLFLGGGWKGGGERPGGRGEVGVKCIEETTELDGRETDTADSLSTQGLGTLLIYSVMEFIITLLLLLLPSSSSTKQCSYIWANKIFQAIKIQQTSPQCDT